MVLLAFVIRPHLVVSVVLALVLSLTGSTAAQPQCRPSGSLATLPGISEASGLAISRRSAGRLWTHNDSGQPVIFALDTKGAIVGQVRLTAATVEDWEALAVGACPGGSCLYVGDMGDNNARRRQITVYRVPEPAGSGTVAAQDIFHATYPDGAHDAEALLLSPDGTLFIVTKGETGGVSLYRFPRELRAGHTHRLERVGQPRDSRRVGAADRVTDGSVSVDGKWVALRSKTKVWLYSAPEFFAGSWKAAREINVASLAEPQGEGIAMDADGTVYLAGEGGGKSRPGTLARLSCS